MTGVSRTGSATAAGSIFMFTERISVCKWNCCMIKEQEKGSCSAQEQEQFSSGIVYTFACGASPFRLRQIACFGTITWKEDGGEREAFESELHGGHVGAPLRCLYNRTGLSIGPRQLLSLFIPGDRSTMEFFFYIVDD